MKSNSQGQRLGGTMGECEVCGAVKVGTRTAMKGRSSIEACQNCLERMGLSITEQPTPSRAPSGVLRGKTSGGFGGTGKKGKDIMVRHSEELRSDFASAIRLAREDKGWDQRELAKRMAERVNIIQHTEGGKHPTDSVIKKFERILGMKLLVTRTIEEESIVRQTSNRPMTMEDLYDQAKKELRGD